MEHLLDNPLYSAMISGNRHLSIGTESVRYFPKEIAPFAGLKEWDEPSFALLADILPSNRVVVTITAGDIAIPASWKTIRQGTILQLIGEHPRQPAKIQDEIVPLNTVDVPQMLELTKMTRPGPFSERTIDFGHYTGIFRAGQLIAMAGYRLRAGGYVEISAVCTHPDHTGKGYAGALLLTHAQQIVQQGKIPFLHVRADNENAIKLYKNSGFLTRREMRMNVFQLGSDGDL